MLPLALRAQPALAVALAILASCCACAAQKAGSLAKTSVASPRITLLVSGGFAGAEREYSISSNGSTLTAVDKNRGLRANRALSKVERAEFDAMFAATRNARPTADAKSDCADCIEYELQTLGNGGKPVVVRLNSMLIGTSPHAALISRLSELGQAALQSKTGTQ
jgi:hypothetical protein